MMINPINKDVYVQNAAAWQPLTSERNIDDMRFTFIGILFLLFAPTGFAAQQPEFLNDFDRKIDRLTTPRNYFDYRLKVKVGGQSRYRYEYRDDFSLNDRTYEDDHLHMLRNRLNLDLSYLTEAGANLARIFVEGQEAHTFAESNLNQTAPLFENWIDLRQLFAEIKSPWKKLPLTVKAGRQELSYGDQRFVGALDWTNTARVFDAIKTIFTLNPQVQLDLFASRVVEIEKEKWDQSQNGDNFYGVYLITRPFKTSMDHELDTFLFIRNNTDKSLPGERTRVTGELKQYTFGNRFKGKKNEWDYGTEYAVQLGSRSHDEIQSWAFHQEFGYTFLKTPWTPRIYTEYNHASGDRNPTDGKFQSFDHLFPTNHNKYGYIDIVGYKNMNDYMVGASVKPHLRMQLSADFHWFLLDAKESAWFNDGGGVVRAANPNADPHLGEELDLLATYRLTSHLNLMLGYAHFFAGPFTEDTGASDDVNFLYTQTVFNF